MMLSELARNGPGATVYVGMATVPPPIDPNELLAPIRVPGASRAMGVGVPVPVVTKTLFDSDTEFTVRNVALLPENETSHPVKLPVVLVVNVSRSIQSRGSGEDVPTGIERFRGPL